jgi:polyisoprenoid-binding protein YceI
MKRIALVITVFTMVVTAAPRITAEEMTFDFKDPKDVNGIMFAVDSKLEPIVGMAKQVEGTMTYDPADPTSLSGSITVPAKAIVLTNSVMQDHLMGPKWLNVQDKLDITFTVGEVTAVQEGEEPVLTVEGKFSIGAVEVDQTVNIAVTHLPDAAKDRGGAKEGDLLVLRSMFTIDRVALGISPDTPTDKVGGEIGIFVPIVGYSK